ncbi:hypothetical protein NE237_008080 [Protea cynaroides]|uniref:Glycine cleavage system P-protein N-terminal domain-containing protein n=1 Tax=Protea cynaroides TaxID=273540 RepID=A0A9Q0KQM8_9MAGN|nr:hypothetical protein NE237_008080 [Protea cynaroides]
MAAYDSLSNCHPQTINVCKTRADGFDLKVITADHKDFDYKSIDVCGVLVQYPSAEGEILDYEEFIKNGHANGVNVVMASDLLVLTMLQPPGEFVAVVVIGSVGVPVSYGGPHAAFLATSQEYKRMMPSRIIGVSVDSSENLLYVWLCRPENSVFGGTRPPARSALPRRCLQTWLLCMRSTMDLRV